MMARCKCGKNQSRVSDDDGLSAVNRYTAGRQIVPDESETPTNG